MLVLTRKPQEKIRIGDDITITIVKATGKSVRVGIEAPPEVTVLRGELLAGDDAAKAPRPAKGSQETSSSRQEVQFARTSKSRVQAILPDLLGEAGPLRELLDRRTEVPH